MALTNNYDAILKAKVPLRDLYQEQATLVDASKRSALISVYKNLVKMRETMEASNMYLTGETRRRYDDLLTQLKADMFDIKVNALDLL